MTNIEKQHMLDGKNLNREFYFTSLLEEAYACGLLSGMEMENIQMQCIKLLADKSEKYNYGESSSIRVEVAENIMKSNLYTIGLYLKSLPDVDWRVSEIKRATIAEMYEKGRKLIDEKRNSAIQIYKLVQKNKISTINYTYNATLDDNGIGIFFKSYNPDYEAHESPASIDYQLCQPVADLVGIEFIHKYLEDLFLENEFCRSFAPEDIHHLLSGYDEGYENLLLNIFEHVLTAALGCLLAHRSVRKLNISLVEIQYLHYELAKNTDYTLAMTIQKTGKKLIKELNITNLFMQRYIEKSLPKITCNIAHAVETNTLFKVFVSPVNLDLKPKVRFVSGVKMKDEDYRKLIDELLVCRYSSDKISLIKEKVKSFGDLEDLMFDALLSEEEITSVFDILGDMEIGTLRRRYPFEPEIQAVDLSEAEQEFRLILKRYIDQLSLDRQEEISYIVNHLVDQ